ncbi:MAG: hypothetical protein ACOVP2_00225, partial [Armatimonadaceae bacterium]
MINAVKHPDDGLQALRLQSMMEDTMDEQITKLETALAALRLSVDDAHQATLSQLDLVSTDLDAIKESAASATELD